MSGQLKNVRFFIKVMKLSLDNLIKIIDTEPNDGIFVISRLKVKKDQKITSFLKKQSKIKNKP